MTDRQAGKSNDAVPDLTDKEIDKVVDAIMRRDDPRKRRHDPIDDFAALVEFAVHCLPGVRRLPPIDLPEVRSAEGLKIGERVVRYVAAYLFAVNPTLGIPDWGRIYLRLLLRRNGRGTFIRVRKRPALAVREDARRMSFTQLQAKYPHLGRAILYRYLREAKQKK